jgi:hypothetical protein
MQIAMKPTAHDHRIHWVSDGFQGYRTAFIRASIATREFKCTEIEISEAGFHVGGLVRYSTLNRGMFGLGHEIPLDLGESAILSVTDNSQEGR